MTHVEPTLFGDYRKRNTARMDRERSLLDYLPVLGDSEPDGWELVDTYFVDSSGVGRSGEPAMTQGEFHEAVEPGFGYGIIAAGPFQVYVGKYRRLTEGTA